ncbi:cytochrome b/b6 domain-containing protein [Slackia exigua]|uniref:cytochrome b/b6 domain-containing protein n=1 Tax=Slackia exigua TaxID=84109 RepID=UPI002004E7A3|nr:cytochrome b/b6 domain-containing protein [Slackia exigua]MCK6139895.1 cytochrome b/b6 domain-containing protein [Slackia exigua]MDK7724628.1 cytochrome b/b6 domain-containing protein [Slackia exigua]MDK7726236.1 cytochrome b/b6 domain-containing protein [Slackia exigua]
MAHLAHYDEAHPLPFRITHWINLVAMVFLIISGCIIHFPFVPGVMGIARGAHIFFGFVLTINCLVRVIMAFVVKSAPTGGTRAVVKDYKTWLPQADNRHQLGAWIKYYLFMKKDHPQSAKLGVPQKISYLLIPVLILIMFVTGLCIWGPTMGATAGLTAALGGTMAVRIIHYFMMFVFIIFIFIHVYLANIEGFAPSKLMFFGKEHEGLHYDVERHVVLAEEQK